MLIRSLLIAAKDGVMVAWEAAVVPWTSGLDFLSHASKYLLLSPPLLPPLERGEGAEIESSY